MPLQENATLRKVSRRGGGGGRVESFDGPPAADPAAVPVWEGAERVYYRERRTRQQTAQGENRFVEGELLVDRDAPVEFAAGQLVEFVRDGDDDATTRTIRMVERRRLDEIPAELSTDRLTLETA